MNENGSRGRRVPSLAVSVVVPTRGGAHRLPDLLEALAAQDLDEPWEVVFVLDGDVDGSRRVIEAYADSVPLRVVELSGGDGVSSALAAGYESATGEIVLRCDDDLTPRPGFIAGHLAWHRTRPDGAPLGVISMTRDVFADTPFAEAYGRPANRRLIVQAYDRPADERWQHWAACNSVPKAAYEAAGGFNTTMTYREDSELGLRLARGGVEMVIDPALEVQHRGPAPDAETRLARAFTSGASTRLFDELHPGTHASTDAPAAGLWGRAVSAAARRLHSRQEAAALGRRIDHVLLRLPPRARGKTIAWGVEAAAQAGRRAGDAAWVREDPTPATSVSIVIPHYGDPSTTLALVRQLSAQTHRAQVVVADDASPTPFPEIDGVEVVRRETNGGFGANVNSGAAAATGDVLLVLNSDLTVEPTFVAEMVAAARTHPRSVLAPRMVDEHGTEAWVGRDFPTIRHQTAAWLTPLARFRGTSTWHRAVGHDVRARRSGGPVDWVVGAAMWIPLAEFRAAGGFDERFYMNSEEVDLQRRLRDRGVRAVALRTPTVVHAGGGSSPSTARRQWLVDGQLTYAEKWGGLRLLRLSLMLCSFVNLGSNCVRRLRGRDASPLRTFGAEMRLLGSRSRR